MLSHGFWLSVPPTLGTKHKLRQHSPQDSVLIQQRWRISTSAQRYPTQLGFRKVEIKLAHCNEEEGANQIWTDTLCLCVRNIKISS